MKSFKILIGILLITAFMSCKKSYVFTQDALIGTWTEVSPCLSPNHCYNFQFNNNDTMIEYGGQGPNLDTFISPYRLFNNNTIQMNQIIVAQGNSGNMTYQISGDDNSLTILNFLPSVNVQSGANVLQSVHLKRN